MVTAVSSADAQSKISNSSKQVSETYQTFLSLLTAQMRNQDPLSPTDPSQWTSQLVQYSSVEQQLLTNSLLSNLVGNGGDMSNAVSFIGKQVDGAYDKTELAGGKATWDYTLPVDANAVEATITNATGNVVWTGPISGLKAGSNSFTWDGRNLSGQSVPAGTYAITLKATDTAGQTLAAKPVVSGTVTGVERMDGITLLRVGNTRVPVDAITSVQSKS
ncbi:MAG: flagellar hook assembly protein FlgD [Asticcacaulis sp.]